MNFFPQIAHCLREICIAENRLRDLSALSLLRNLTFVDAEDNLIESVEEGLAALFASVRFKLRALKLKGNPLCALAAGHAWRDDCVDRCVALELLNDRAISANEKAFITQKMKRKRLLAGGSRQEEGIGKLGA